MVIIYLFLIQRQGLGPVVSHLPTLSQEYKSLANALDTTRHQIPTKGIHLPDNEDQFQGKVTVHCIHKCLFFYIQNCIQKIVLCVFVNLIFEDSVSFFLIVVDGIPTALHPRSEWNSCSFSLCS